MYTVCRMQLFSMFACKCDAVLTPLIPEETRLALQQQANEQQRLEQEKLVQRERDRQQALLRQQQAWLQQQQQQQQQQHSVASHQVLAQGRQSGPSLLQIQQEEEAQAMEQVATYYNY